MARAFLAGALLVLVVQASRFSAAQWNRVEFVFVGLPATAILLFLCGLAASARRARGSSLHVLLAAYGSLSLALSTAPELAAPQIMIAPAVEFALRAIGAVCLVASAVFLYRWNRQVRPIAAALVGVAGLLGGVEYLRAALLRYAWYFQPESLGLSGLYERTMELTVLFGLGGVLALLGGAAMWKSRPTTG